MSQICEFLGTKPMTGNKVSHSNRKARTRWNLNLVNKRYPVPELGRTVAVTVSTSAIRTIDKFGGLSQALVRYKDVGFSTKLKRLRRDIIARKSGKVAAAKPAPAPAPLTEPQDQPQDQPQDKA